MENAGAGTFLHTILKSGRGNKKAPCGYILEPEISFVFIGGIADEPISSGEMKKELPVETFTFLMTKYNRPYDNLVLALRCAGWIGTDKRYWAH